MTRNSELREELLQRFPSLAALWDHEPKHIKKGGKGIKKGDKGIKKGKKGGKGIKKDDTRCCLRCGVPGHLMRDVCFVCLCVCLCVCLFVCLFVYLFICLCVG